MSERHCRFTQHLEGSTSNAAYIQCCYACSLSAVGLYAGVCLQPSAGVIGAQRRACRGGAPIGGRQAVALADEAAQASNTSAKQPVSGLCRRVAIASPPHPSLLLTYYSLRPFTCRSPQSSAPSRLPSIPTLSFLHSPSSHRYFFYSVLAIFLLSSPQP